MGVASVFFENAKDGDDLYYGCMRMHEHADHLHARIVNQQINIGVHSFTYTITDFLKFEVRSTHDTPPKGIMMSNLTE